MRSSIRILLTFLAGSLAGLAVPATLRAQCGVERWSVKTGTDPDAGLVDLASSTSTTVATMRGLTAPNPIPTDSRVAPTETTVWVINATLTEYKLESDSDYHLVLADANGDTMIAEIPSPSCVGSGSPFLTEITNARSEFDAVYTPTTSFKTANVPVQITGVGMFDFLHGQTGVAPNGIELHPVLNIVFNPSTTPDFSLAVNPGSVSAAQGGTASLTVSSSASGGFNAAVSLSASGLPSGVTASFSPTSIAAPGSGSSTLTLAVGNFTAAGTYAITVSGSGGGVNHTSSVSLTVSSSGGGSLANGDFEAGSLSGWTASGVAAVNASARHGGSYGAQLGSSSPSTDSAISQTFTLPAGSPTVSFWYANTCPDTVTYDWATATLKDNVTNTTSTILAKTCTTSPVWTQVVSNATASAGHSVTLTLANHDDNYSGDATYTYYDDVAVATASPDFSLSVTPGSLSVAQGGSGSAGVSTSVSGGFNSSVALSASGVPAGTTVSFSPASIAAPGSGSSTMSVAVGASTTPGTYTITVTGSGGGVTHTASVALTVTSAAASQLMGNPGFENGSSNPAPWVAASGVIDNSTGEAPHSGSWKAWLDGYGSAHTDTIYQPVAIPSTITTATLTFWLHIDTAETGSTAYDTLRVQIRNSSGTVLATLATYSNLNHNTGYVQKSFDVSAYKGQTIQVYLIGVEDASLQTSFVVDDFALTVQ